MKKTLKNKTLNNWGRNELKNFMIRWSNKFPFDTHFRRKNNIRFGSKEHKELNFAYIALDQQEEILILESKASFLKQEINKKLYEESGIWLNPPNKKININQTLSQAEFDSIDLSKF